MNRVYSLALPALSLALATLTGCPFDGTSAVAETDTDGTTGDDQSTMSEPSNPATGQLTTTAGDDETTTGSVDTTAANGVDDDDDDGVVDEGTGGSSCCSPHPEVGCDNPDIAECVCEQSAFCCAFEWDQACADLAVNSCGGCDEMPTDDGSSGDDTTDTGVDGGTCCAAQEEPGCSNAEVEACVCAEDDFCCEMMWDAMCVQAAVATCNAQCGAPPNDCCAATEGAGCGLDDVQECVCAIDSACCDEAWTGTCAALGVTDCDNSCPGIEIKGEGGCCEPTAAPGCDDLSIQLCTCALDPFCCDQEWDGLCIEQATLQCDAGCKLPAGDCCEANVTPGCEDKAVQTCTCDLDPTCCEDPWSDECVTLAQDSCALECDTGSCCAPNGSPGCNEPEVQECTCAIDAFCCDNMWDDKCVAAAVENCMLECDAGSCCEPNGSPGCNEPEVQECTCAIDAFCCDNMWDDKCVAAADENCMPECAGGSTGTSGGGSDSGSDGATDGGSGGSSDTGVVGSTTDAATTSTTGGGSSTGPV